MSGRPAVEGGRAEKLREWNKTLLNSCKRNEMVRSVTRSAPRCCSIPGWCLALAAAIALARDIEGHTHASRAHERAGPIVIAQGADGRRSTPRGLAELHKLHGRTLHTRASKKSQILMSAGKEGAPGVRSAARGDKHTKAPNFSQYLVRVEFPRPDGLAEYLQELSGGKFFKYLPHDTFVMTLSAAELSKARKAAGVNEVYELPPAMKIEPDLLVRMHSIGSKSPTHHEEFLAHIGVKRRSAPTSTRASRSFDDVVIQVMLAHGGPGWVTKAEAMVAGWKKSLDGMGFSVSITLASKKKAIVTIKNADALKGVIGWLVNQPLVHWIQEQKKITIRNKMAGVAMQSWNASTHEIWNRGIIGTGQIVGIADTGIDYDNCFFRDKVSLSPPRCSGTGHVTTAGCISNTHRKIVTYRKFYETDYNDYNGGHGTHVAGSVAGSALDDDATQRNFASQYNGAAPGAKIAFDDVGDGVGDLTGIPYDLASGLFPHAYAAGARIHTNSWGSTATYYDTMAMEIDEFTHANDDFLVLVAAGNDGPSMSTVGAPATAKNILAVGATENAGGASSIPVEMKITFANGDTEQYEVTPAAFGADWARTVQFTKSMHVANPQNGCTAIGSTVSGKIALVQRGACNFDTKVLNAQNAGAVAVIVYNNVDGEDVTMSGANDAASVKIPAAFISKSHGSALHATAEAGITATIPIFPIPLGSDVSHHKIASFSSRGPTDELRIKPDVLCPGANIHSAHSDGNVNSNNCGASIGTSSSAVSTMSGTSMAAPLCAGAAALVRDYFIKGFSADGLQDESKKVTPSAALVKAVMIHSAQDVKTDTTAGLAYELSYPNYKTGYGRVELSSALRFEDSDFEAIYKDRQLVLDGGHVEFCFRVGASAGANAPPASRDFRVSMVWTDPPGDPMSYRSLINDLDLVVNGPNDDVFYGNNLKQRDETNSEYGIKDANNNAEQVRVTSVDGGLYAVRVFGTDVPSGPQEFALVASASSIQIAPSSECTSLKCPHACSGRGVCLNSGACECPLTHGGADCSREYRVLEPVADASAAVTLKVSWTGMNYYRFEIEEGGSFELSFSPGAQCSTCDADFYLSKNAHPTAQDYDGAIADQNSGGTFRSVGNAQGTWYVGLLAFSGDVAL